VDVGDTGTGLVGSKDDVIHDGDPILGIGDGIDRDGMEILRGEVVDGLRSGLLVHGVVVDGFAHFHQVLFEDRFFAAQDRALVVAGGDAD